MNPKFDRGPVVNFLEEKQERANLNRIDSFGRKVFLINSLCLAFLNKYHSCYYNILFKFINFGEI